jgi:hypothetical protein
MQDTSCKQLQAGFDLSIQSVYFMHDASCKQLQFMQATSVHASNFSSCKQLQFMQATSSTMLHFMQAASVHASNFRPDSISRIRSFYFMHVTSCKQLQFMQETSSTILHAGNFSPCKLLQAGFDLPHSIFRIRSSAFDLSIRCFAFDSMFRIRCFAFDVLHSMFRIRCFAFDVSHSMFRIRCFAFDVSHSIFRIHLVILHALMHPISSSSFEYLVSNIKSRRSTFAWKIRASALAVGACGRPCL